MLQLIEWKDGAAHPVASAPDIHSITDIFKGSESLLAVLPPGDYRFTPFHLNTLHNPLLDRDEVEIERLEVVPFRVYGIEPAQAVAISAIIAENLELDVEKLGVIAHADFAEIYVLLEVPLTEESFQECVPHYAAVIADIEVSVRAQGFIKARVENIWNKRVLLSFPVERKQIVWASLEPQDFSLWFSSKLNEPDVGEVLPPEHMKAYPKPDTKGVLEGCAFLRERGKVAALSQGEKDAALSILIHAAGKSSTESLDLCHEFAANWDRYSREGIWPDISRQAAFGPTSCVHVDKVCGTKSLCKSCPHWGHITSPVQIQSHDYIATESTGFHIIIPGEKRTQKIPDYDGLRRYYRRQAPYLTIAESEEIYKWDGKIWKPVVESYLKSFAQTKFNPLADTRMANEFLNLVKRTELQPHEWFGNSTNRLMNFQNGVLDIKSMEFKPHSHKLGFRTVLPYDYDPSATCPQFEKFLREVTLEREELIQVILEFAGYSLSGDSCWEQKALVLLGEGQNGKSKLVSVIKALAGEGASTSQTFVDLEKDTNRAALDGSLFNIAEETPSKSLMDSSLFKALIGGAEVSVKKLYQQPYEIRNRAKFWLLCNEMPRSADKAHALIRRLCIVPFEARFEGAKDDKHIEKKLFTELPGILNLVLAAYKRMVDRGGLLNSDIAKQKLEEYRMENDNVFRFITDCCEDLGATSEYWIKPEELYMSYRKYVDDQGEKGCTSASFFKRLAGAWRPYTNRRSRKKLPTTGEVVRVVYGIKIAQGYRVGGIRNFSVVE